jgi:acetylornithine/succinyldiaminopimelate/putrescine aminotransferase
MWLIFSVWLCIASAFLMPPAFTMALCFALALVRILFLTHVSLIEAGAEAIGEARKIAERCATQRTRRHQDSSRMGHCGRGAHDGYRIFSNSFLI